MHDELLGYLLGALEPDEQERVRQYLESQPEARRKLEFLRSRLVPFDADREHFEPPAGLASRTCQFVSAFAESQQPVVLNASGSASWRWIDWSIAAVVCTAAILLLFPAINYTRGQQQMMACANNLRALGTALSNYSRIYAGYLPYVPPEGKLAAAGIYGPTLVHGGFVTETEVLHCPADQAHPSPSAVPTLSELMTLASDSNRFNSVRKAMGGSYAYVFGYEDESGRYQGARNQGRDYFVVMADRPPQDTSRGGERISPNHGGHGHNVLYEAGNVRWLKTCTVGPASDDIFVNARGQVAAGIGPEDVVLGPSEAAPHGNF